MPRTWAHAATKVFGTLHARLSCRSLPRWPTAWAWSHDGKALIFQRAASVNVIYRAAVMPTAEFSLGQPAVLVRLPENYTYAWPAPDLKRFLALVPAEKPQPQTITVLQNWQAALQQH